MNQRYDRASPVRLFYSYAREDEALRNEIEKHLSLLQRQGLLISWFDRRIAPGTDWSKTVDTHLNSAEIILLLISSDFLASDYCYGIEMQHALERHEHGETQVIPIILRPVEWQNAPFAYLQGLPRDMKPVTSWSNQDEALLNIAQGIRWTIEHLQGVSMNNQTIVLQYKDTQSSLSDTKQPLVPRNSQDRQNRQHFLAYLNTSYREAQEQSLRGVALMALRLQSKPDAVAPPTRLIFRYFQQAERILPPETDLLHVYEQSGGDLLVLGEPGSGKSTLLTHFAQSLLIQAQSDEQQRLPVIFNLSSWAGKRRPLAEWLVEELVMKYQVPRKVGMQWIHNGQLLPLLDGLDEVTVSARSSCIDTINAYRRDYLIPLIVCSRTTEYFMQQHRLLFQSAVVIEPLTNEQINKYLTQAGTGLIALHTILQKNQVLRELATSPLLLNILTLTYRNTEAELLPEQGSQEEQQRQVFNSYVNRMLPAHGSTHHLSQNSMLKCLTWLAKQMNQHNQTEFYLEQLQPDWLPTRWIRHLYTVLGVLFPNVIIGSFTSIIINIVLISIRPSTTNSAFNPGIFLNGLLGGLLGGLLSCKQLFFSGKQRRLSHLFLILGMVVIFAMGFGFGGFFAFNRDGWRFIVSKVAGICFGSTGILLTLLYLGTPLHFLNKSTQALIDTAGRRLIWLRVITSYHLRTGLLIGGLLGLSWSIRRTINQASFSWVASGFYSYYHKPYAGLYHNIMESGISYGMIYGLIGTCLSLMLIRKSDKVVPTEVFIWSWKSIWHSLTQKEHLKNTSLISLITFIGFGLSQGLGGGANTLGAFYLKTFFGYALAQGLGGALSISGCYWLLVGLFQGVSSQRLQENQRVFPNQGIWRSAQNGLLLGGISAGICGFVSWLGILLSVATSFTIFDWTFNGRLGSYDLSFYFSKGRHYSIIAGLIGGLLVFLLNGGLAWWRHWLLRFLLWLTRTIPWNYVQFLNEAAYCILLRKVRSGYIFIHRQFQDYIASLNTAPLPSQETVNPTQDIQRLE